MRPADVVRIGANRARLAARLLKPDGTIGFDELPTAAAVRVAYNTVLLREPEPDGLAHFAGRLRD